MDPRRAPLFSVGGGCLSTLGAGGVADGGGGAKWIMGKKVKIWWLVEFEYIQNWVEQCHTMPLKIIITFWSCWGFPGLSSTGGGGCLLCGGALRGGGRGRVRLAPHGTTGCDPRGPNGVLTREGFGGGVWLRLAGLLEWQLLLQGGGGPLVTELSLELQNSISLTFLNFLLFFFSSSDMRLSCALDSLLNCDTCGKASRQFNNNHSHAVSIQPSILDRRVDKERLARLKNHYSTMAAVARDSR